MSVLILISLHSVGILPLWNLFSQSKDNQLKHAHDLQFTLPPQIESNLTKMSVFQNWFAENNLEGKLIVTAFGSNLTFMTFRCLDHRLGWQCQLLKGFDGSRTYMKIFSTIKVPFTNDENVATCSNHISRFSDNLNSKLVSFQIYHALSLMCKDSQNSVNIDIFQST